MDIETQGLGAGSYPEPKEEKMKEIEAKIVVSYTIQYDVPEKWDKDQIVEDIKENLYCLEKYDEEIEKIEIQ